jgi:uncharacterized protein (TIGR03435 family)
MPALHLMNAAAACWALLAILGCGAAHAQQSAVPPRPSFEAASVKVHPNCQYDKPMRMSPGSLELDCVTLRVLIGMAWSNVVIGNTFNMRPLRVVGGDKALLDGEHYDVHAKASGNVPTSLIMGPMLQSLLEDRFHVTIHREQRETPVYALTVSGKPKLSPAAKDSCIPLTVENQQATRDAFVRGDRPTPARFCGAGTNNIRGGTLSIDSYGTTMDEFAARVLSVQTDRPVIDKTGLTGAYDIHLEFAVDSARRGPVRLNGMDVPAAEVPDDLTVGPSIFTALKQLGLKLSPDKAPIEVIVVDLAEKPSAN